MIKIGIRAVALVAGSLLALGTEPAWAIDYTSAATGNWTANATWGTSSYPLTGGGDSVVIQGGNTVTYTSGGVGLLRADGTGSGDFGVDNGNTITVNGGTLSQTGTSWVRIGNLTSGTLDIKDGGAYLNGFLQVGVDSATATGTVKVGDGIGAAGSAVVSLRYLASGATTNAGDINEINLGQFSGSSGTITIESDGILEGDAALTGNTGSGTIRIGRRSSATQSAIYVKAGGQFLVHTTVEVGSDTGANGLLHLSGIGAKLTQDAGGLLVGYNGLASMVLENSAQYVRQNVAGSNLVFARNTPSVVSLIIRTNAQFIRETGGSVGDFIMGLNGTATMTVETGGVFLNQSTNWDWIGRGNGSNASVEVKATGTFRTTNNASFVIGSEASATGLLLISGGSFSMEHATGGEFRIGENGTATFRQTSGSSAIRRVVMSTTAGTSTFDIQGGTFTTREDFLMGGGSATANNSSTSTATQSGGSVDVAGNLSIGMGIGSNASYTMTGGELKHRTGNTTVGYSGRGTLTVGSGAQFTDDSTGEMFVGRENASNGTLIVNGTMTKNATTGIRVGYGNGAVTNGTNNTTGTGLLGGTGTITAQGGITVGNNGRIGAGLNNTVGTLTINGSVNLLSTSGSTPRSTLFVNFDSSNALKSDRLVIHGDLSLSNAVIDGTWAAGSETGLDSRYWVVVNEGTKAFQGDPYFSNMALTSTNDWAALYLQMGANGFVTIGGQQFAMFYGADFGTGALTGGNDLMLSAISAAPVPEPSLSILCLLGASAGLMRRRRR